METPIKIPKRLPISKEDRLTVYERDDFRCRFCDSRDLLSVDHIIPISKGGSNSLDNYQTLCKYCNSMKSTYDKVYLPNFEQMILSRLFFGKSYPDYEKRQFIKEQLEGTYITLWYLKIIYYEDECGALIRWCVKDFTETEYNEWKDLEEIGPDKPKFLFGHDQNFEEEMVKEFWKTYREPSEAPLWLERRFKTRREAVKEWSKGSRD